MEEKKITLPGKALKPFAKIQEKFEGLGFSYVSSDKDMLVLEKAQTQDLRGRMHHFYRISFHPKMLVLTYSAGAGSRRRELDAISALLDALRIADDFYSADANGLVALLEQMVAEDISSSEFGQQDAVRALTELKEKYGLLEKKYKDLALSSEQNARMLLENEKKKDEYYERIKALEGLSDEGMRQEVFKWLRTHGGAMSTSEFAKVHNVPRTRVEETLEYMVKNGYVRKRQ